MEGRHGGLFAIAAVVGGAGILALVSLASRPLTIPRYSSFGHSPGGRRRAFQAKHLSLYATVWMEVHE